MILMLCWYLCIPNIHRVSLNTCMSSSFLRIWSISAVQNNNRYFCHTHLSSLYICANPISNGSSYVFSRPEICRCYYGIALCGQPLLQQSGCLCENRCLFIRSFWLEVSDAKYLRSFVGFHFVYSLPFSSVFLFFSHSSVAGLNE